MKNAVTRTCAWVSAALLSYGQAATAQTVETFAGGRLINDLPATEASVTPGSLAAAPDGSIYMVDSNFRRLLRKDPANSRLYTFPPDATQPLQAPWDFVSYVFFGPNGVAYVLAGGSGSIYQLNTTTGQLVLRAPTYQFPWNTCQNGGSPRQFAVDGNGAVYYVDASSNSICKNVGSSIVPIVTSAPGFSGDGGPAELATINMPYGIAIDAANNIFFSDQGNNRIRKISASTGIITTIAGNGQAAYAGENVVAATSSINSPSGLAFDSAGHLTIAESGSLRVRRIDAQTGRISTIAGNGSAPPSGEAANGVPATTVSAGYVNDIAIHPSGDLLFSDTTLRLVRRVARATGILTTAAGNGASNFCGETSLPRDACMDRISGVAVATNGDVYISDSGNKRIRKVTAATGMLTTYAGRSGPANQFLGNGGPAADVLFPSGPLGLWLDSAGNLYVAGGYGNRLYRIDNATGILTTVAGTGATGFSGDGGPATAARIDYVDSVAIDGAGNIYISNPFGQRVRKIAAGTGIITTYAGNGSNTGPLGDGGPATAASFYGPKKLGFDKSGNLLIVDNTHNRIRMVDKTTGIITTVVGNGTFGNAGDGGLATAASLAPSAFTTDPLGNLTMINGTVRRVDMQTGIINTVPNVPHRSPEGHSINPYELAFDSTGKLYDAASTAVLRISGLPYSLPDTTPPVIQPSVSGALGADGWYTGDVQVTWSVTEAESGVTSKAGCDATLVTQDTAGITLTCSATSGGGTNSSSVTLKRDATAPALTFDAVTPAANANGWNGSDVSIAFTTSDDTSGVATTSETSPLAFSNEGIGMSQSVTVTDNAGNSATFTSPAVSIDKTPPVVSADVSGPAGSNGWYVGDVQVGWSVNEIPASIESSTGCGTTSVTLDTPESTFTCSVTSAGGSASSSTTVRRDATSPALVFSTPSPVPNVFGWYNYDTSIPFSVADATSGIASTSEASPLTLTNEGVGLSRSVTVTDVAGNAATFTSPPINIDKTYPLVAPVVTGTLGNNDWYVSDVTVSWSILEMPESLREIYGCETSTVTTDTGPDGVMFGCVVNSQGGAMGVPQWIKRDTTPATVQWGTFSPVPNANGWNKTNVSVPFTASDALSGVASSSASPLVISAEGAGVTGQVTVTDRAGNVATISSPPRNIDKTAPVVSLTSPANGASYGFYQDVVADYSCTDISLLSCTAPNPDGAMVNTKTAGARTFKVTAKDSVSFTTAVTNSFNVASTFNFEGFLPNVAPAPTPNLVARGSLVPIRWRLPDGNGGFVSNTASFTSASVTSLSCSGTAVPLNDPATGPAGISYDPSTNVFTYNWQTGASWSGCRRIAIRLRDNSIRELIFRFQ